MVTLRVKSKTGQVMDVAYDALISVDGVPYKASADDIRDAVLHLDGRVAAIESFISGMLRPESTEHK